MHIARTAIKAAARPAALAAVLLIASLSAILLTSPSAARATESG